MSKIHQIYKILRKQYSPQGWWPLLELRNTKMIQHTKCGSIQGYHPGDYSFPRNEKQKFEIILGAILTQNTAWPNVEKALQNLNKENLLAPASITRVKIQKLRNAIRPAGYFNQKAAYIKNITKFFMSLKDKIPTRTELLSVKGVGNETADSILLYAYKQPEFVVDTYTKRFLIRNNIPTNKASYLDIKELFESNIPREVPLYQEFHALIVEAEKQQPKS